MQTRYIIVSIMNRTKDLKAIDALNNIFIFKPN